MSSNITNADIPSRFSAMILAIALHSILWIAWLLGLCLLIPRFEKVFRDVNVRLPDVTVMVLSLEQWVNSFPLFAVIFLCLFLAIDGMIYFWLRSSTRRFASELWSAFMFLLPAFVIAGTATGLLLPLLTLPENLSGGSSK
jgi:type II secretory pathway component PulF